MFTTQQREETVDKPLGLMLVDADHWMVQSVLNLMSARGFDLNPADISFLANLDCGETHASAVARRMGISRQAVYRTTRALKARGVLELIDDPDRGNQKIVVMTDHGRAVVTAARVCLAEVEAELARRIGEDKTQALTSALSADWGAAVEARDQVVNPGGSS